MPIQAGMIVAICALVLALAVWFRTRRAGPVFGVMIAAFIVMAITDPDLLAQGGQMVADLITWAFDTLINI